jgi:hypothetical protein
LKNLIPKPIMLGALFALSISTTSIHAAGSRFRTYLSAKGSDTNACTVDAPCRLLPAALAATQTGGEIWILDSANYNSSSVTITQSVTILAVPGALGSLVAVPVSGSIPNALTITGSNLDVTLRNVVLVNLSGTIGDGAQVIVFTAPQSRLVIEGSEFGGGLTSALVAEAQEAQILVHHSTFRSASMIFSTLGSGSPSLSGVIDHCTISGLNGSTGSAVAIDANNANVIVSHSSISGAYVGLGSYAGAVATINDDVFANNNIGVQVTSSSADTMANNTFQFNSNDVDGTLTTVLQK